MNSISTPTRPNPYRQDIDGLRAIAVLPVVGFHLFPKWISGGFIGVDIFFVISGYLISTLILHDLVANTFSYKQFYVRRVRRIFPALISVVACVTLAGWFVLPEDEFKSLGKHIASAGVFISNFVFWNESGYFDASAEAKPLLHLWSLAIEEQFYVFWPLLVALSWKRQRYFLALICSLLAASITFSLVTTFKEPTAAFYSPICRIWELLAGAFIAYFHVRDQHRINRFGNAESLFGAVLILIGFGLVTKSSEFPGWWALLPTLGTCLLIHSGPNSAINKLILSQPPLRWIGNISYPIYLWHWPLISLAFIANHYQTPSAAQRVVIFFATILLAWITAQLVERPVRFDKRISTPVLSFAFVVVSLTGGLIFAANGFPNRAANQDAATSFINGYAKLHKFGISDYYQERCDFYDWKTGHYRKSIGVECAQGLGPASSVLLWGDSHAQALSYGFRKNLAAPATLAQVTTSGCKPSLVKEGSNRKSRDAAGCYESNRFAMQVIERSKPNKVYVAQATDHDQTDWQEIADFVKRNGGELFLIGPVPQWRPSLPVIVARQLPSPDAFQKEGLDRSIFEVDSKINAKYKNSSVHSISLIQHLCNKNGCLAKVKTSEPFDLLLLDYGHLTPAGSDYVVRDLVLKHEAY